MPAPQIISKSPARHVSPQKVRLAVVNRGDALSEAFRLIGAAVRFERNTEIHGEDEPAAGLHGNAGNSCFGRNVRA